MYFVLIIQMHFICRHFYDSVIDQLLKIYVILSYQRQLNCLRPDLQATLFTHYTNDKYAV